MSIVNTSKCQYLILQYVNGCPSQCLLLTTRNNENTSMYHFVPMSIRQSQVNTPIKYHYVNIFLDLSIFQFVNMSIYVITDLSLDVDICQIVMSISQYVIISIHIDRIHKKRFVHGGR